MSEYDFLDGPGVHPHLTFDEANIVQENILSSKPPNTPGGINISEFMYRLDNLLRHTPDSCLSGSILSLREKVRHLSQAEFEQLWRDCEGGRAMLPENYALPTI